MRIAPRRRSTLLAATAALALVASLTGAANAAYDPISTFLKSLTSAPSTHKVNLGQGSGIAGSFGR